MRNVILVSIIIFSWSILISKDYPTKRELKKLFSERQEYFSEFKWTVCNDDSAYFKNDTIILFYRNATCFEKHRCCEFVHWTFHNARSLQIGKLRVCQEPPISSFGYTENPYSIKFNRKWNKLQLQITSRDNKIDKFQVEQLTRCKGKYLASGEIGYRLTLIRMK